MMTDPVADMLTRIRNSIRANHDRVDIPASKMKANICRVFKEEGYIRSFKIIVKDKTNVTLRVMLKEDGITDLQRVSRPGLRIYKKHDNVPRVINGLGICVLSTSKGIISSRNAKKLNVGGEVLCKIW